MKRLGSKVTGGTWAVFAAVALAALTATAAYALAPGASGEGPDNVPRADGTFVDNGGLWGVAEHRAQALRARQRIYSSALKQNDSSLALSGFDQMVALFSRVGRIYSDVPPPFIAPINMPNFNGWARYSDLPTDIPGPQFNGGAELVPVTPPPPFKGGEPTDFTVQSWLVTPGSLFRKGDDLARLNFGPGGTRMLKAQFDGMLLDIALGAGQIYTADSVLGNMVRGNVTLSVASWNVAVGDEVAKGDTLLELASTTGATSLPVVAPYSGTLTSIGLPVGAPYASGMIVGQMMEAGFQGAGNPLLPPHSQLDMVVYNKYANIGMDGTGTPNTLAVALANGVVNSLDTYYGNLGGLQRIGHGPGGGLSLSGGASAGASATVNPMGRTGGSVTFSGTAASNIGGTKTGYMAEYAQEVNAYLFGALMMSGTDVNGAGGTDANGNEIHNFSALQDAMDFNFDSGSGQVTWARKLVDALNGQNGTMTILRAIAGQGMPYTPSSIGGLYDVTPYNPDGDRQSILEVGLPAYYGAMCEVMEAKTAIYNLTNTTATFPAVNFVAAGACDPRVTVREDPGGGTQLVATYRNGYTSVTGFSNSHRSSLADFNPGNIASGAAEAGFNRLSKTWNGDESAVQLGSVSIQRGGPDNNAYYIGLPNLITANSNASASVTGCNSRVCRTETASAGGSAALGLAQIDQAEVMRRPARDYPGTTEVDSPYVLPTWRPAPYIPPNSSPSFIVGSMP